MAAVKFDDLSTAFDFVSFAAPLEHQAFVSLDTGAIYWISEAGGVGDEELPPDLDTSDRYVAVPHRNDLDLGLDLVLRFVREVLPHQDDKVAAMFWRPGAYGRFKSLLDAEGRLDEWYAFEADATKQALQDWCTANGLAPDDEQHSPSA
jgi:hypothetical protein